MQAALGGHVLDHAGDDAAYQLVGAAGRIEAGIAGIDLAQNVADHRYAGDVVEREQIGAQAVVDIVGVIGDVVGNGRGLRLGAGKRPQFQILDARIGRDRRRHAMRGIAADGSAGTVGERAVVLGEAFQRLPGEVEPVELGIAALERGDDAQGLRVVVEAAEIFRAGLERALAGVAEGRMAEIVRERGGLGEVLVEAERAGKRTRDLDHFQRMGEPCAVMVALVIDEDLRLMGEAAESGRVDDPVTVAAEIVARGARRLGITAAAAQRRVGGVRRARNGRGNGHISLNIGAY